MVEDLLSRTDPRPGGYRDIPPLEAFFIALSDGDSAGQRAYRDAVGTSPASLKWSEP